MRFFLLLLVTLSVADRVCGGEHWPSFRGNEGNQGATRETLPDHPELLFSLDLGDEISATPVGDSTTLYLGTLGGIFYAVNRSDQSIRWKKTSSGGIEGSALLLKDRVYVTSLDGSITAYAAADGNEIWQVKLQGKIASSPNWAARSGQETPMLLITGYDHHLRSFDTANGSPLWAVESGSFINGSASVTGENALFGGCDAGVEIVAHATGERRGRVNAGSYIAGSVAADSASAFIGTYDGRLLALDLQATPPVIRWMFQAEGENAAFVSSPAFNERWVVAGCRNHRLYALDRSSGSLHWTFSARGAIDTSPVLAGDRVLFAADDGWLYLLNLDSGEKVWSYELGGVIKSSPAVIGSEFFIGTPDGRLCAFGSRPKK